MSILSQWKAFKNQEFRFSTVLVFLVIILAFIALRTGNQKQYLNFAEALDETAALVDGEELTLRDLAFYIAFEEQQVEKDAYVYNPEDTSEYWNLYSNGTYIRKAAKQAALDMAVHDKIFYEMACGEGIELDEQEEKRLANYQYDFWSDLEEEQIAWLGVSQEVLNESLRKLAIAEKYQSIYAQIQNDSAEEYSFEEEKYQKLLETHEVTVIEETWDYVRFGFITVHHKDN